ncbi:RagB/SusD family nutrient uptake outer membrane protein [Pseudochryseolinea flava]|uniref:RagB/SusD family nutrient uptake outer membrane protein n=1 Tax=Pseudochryseolinea flava TaxID=2059302 RepID=A0A364XXB7_9BACT|nr:RagB/SusD family nutrient uptake outer membrane protein [Pseudochryseolinea flava]RAV98905.1 RagB/SusD family nutrient uptake outer membrane protein [Pseudochryseolinea flava]
MKTIHKIFFSGTACLLLFLAGCNSILDEQPRSIYTPDYFKTEKGVHGGLTGMYAHLRYIFGNAYFYNSTLTGTDEATWGASGSGGGFQIFDLSGAGLITASNSDASNLWFNTFPNINTANGVIENASAVGVSDALIAEARFFRAFDYFMLVQTFGGVPLDLGAGELKFNTSVARNSVRNTVPEVYTRAIFPDLLQAVANLPETGRVTGGVTKTLARLYLAKAYLTYAWWLENPNNIPTYPETDRTDPDGHNAQWYFQQAYDIATTAIDNPGPFGLVATYYDLHVGTNDRNKELLLYADHTQTSELYNGSSLSFGSGGDADNFAVWMLTWNYTALQSSKTSWASPQTVNSVQREAAQGLGRPWVRMAPPHGVFENTFADKENDARYDGTFSTSYRGNWPKAGVTNSFLYNANDLTVEPGDAILTFLDEVPADAIDYSNSVYKSNVGAGVLPGRADYVIAPNAFSRLVYPGLWKLGTYRTDNAGGLGQPNAANTRPFNIAKFSELYFVAAEAAVKGAATLPGKSAYDLINVIRARAGKWRWSNKENVEKIEDHSADVVAETPATIDINYILAERSREYYGEGYRWYDLVRTQKWEEIAGSYTICGTAVGDRTPVTVTRQIQITNYLRPVPQGQLDNMNVSIAEKDDYQNPGYRVNE